MKLLGMILFLLLTSNCYAGTQCNIVDPDQNGYLQVICDYLVVNNIDVSPGKPNEYQIRKITETTYNGIAAVTVQLNCCYLGGIAIINPATMKVLHFDVEPVGKVKI